MRYETNGIGTAQWEWFCVKISTHHPLPDGMPEWLEAHLQQQSRRMPLFKDHCKPFSHRLWIRSGRQLVKKPSLCTKSTPKLQKKFRYKSELCYTSLFLIWSASSASRKVCLKERWHQWICIYWVLQASEGCIRHVMGTSSYSCLLLLNLLLFYISWLA